MRAALVLALLLPVLPAAAGGPAPPVARAAGGAVWVPTLPVYNPLWDAPENLSAFANGVAYAYTLNQDTYFRSDDFGETWQPMAQPPFVFMTDGTTAPWTGGWHGQPGFVTIRFATPDLGYAHQNYWRSPGWPGPALDDPRRPCRRVDTYLSRTVDGGATWTPMCLWRNRPGTWFHAPCCWKIVHAAKGTRTVAVVGGDIKPYDLLLRPKDYSTLVGAVYTSHDAGATWVRAGLARHYRPDARIPMGFFGSRYGAVVAHDVKLNRDGTPARGYPAKQSVLVTRDGGRRYRPVLDCARPDERVYCTAVEYVTKNRLVVGFSNGTTKVSDNGGRTWRRGQSLVTPPTARDAARARVSARLAAYRGLVQDFAFTDARHGFASTLGTGTWRTSDGGRKWVQERSHECELGDYLGSEIAAATPERAIVGGGPWISTRVPLPQEQQHLGGQTCADPARRAPAPAPAPAAEPAAPGWAPPAAADWLPAAGPVPAAAHHSAYDAFSFAVEAQPAGR